MIKFFFYILEDQFAWSWREWSSTNDTYGVMKRTTSVCNGSVASLFYSFTKIPDNIEHHFF